MSYKIRLLLIVIIFFSTPSGSFAIENFYEKGKQKYNEKTGRREPVFS